MASSESMTKLSIGEVETNKVLYPQNKSLIYRVVFIKSIQCLMVFSFRKHHTEKINTILVQMNISMECISSYLEVSVVPADF